MEVRGALVLTSYASRYSLHTADTVLSGFRICLLCFSVHFKDEFYLPNRGDAMGACHVCDFIDILMGDMHIDTCKVDTIHFLLYRDDGWDILLNGEQDLQRFKD